MDPDLTISTTPAFDSGSDAGVNSSTDITFNDILDAGGKLLNTATGVLNAASPYMQLSADIAKAGAQQAAGYYQQAMYEVQAIDTLRLAQIRTDQDQKYASIQAGRKLKQAEMQALNYTIAGNTLLRGMERANAAVRARAAANGTVSNEGSAASIQAANVGATYRDVGITNLNALTARIMGYEDASAMVLAAKEQADLTMNAAETQAKQLRMAGDFAVKSGGLLSGVSFGEGVLRFAQTRTPT